MFARRASAAHSGEPSRAGERSTNSDDCRSLRGCRLHDAAATRGKWPMRHGAICVFRDQVNVERATAVAAGQPGGLRSDRNATHDRFDSDSRDRNVIYR